MTRTIVVALTRKVKAENNMKQELSSTKSFTDLSFHLLFLMALVNSYELIETNQTLLVAPRS